MFVCTYVRMCVCMHEYRCVCMCVCMHVRMHVYMHVAMYICMYVHVGIYVPMYCVFKYWILLFNGLAGCPEPSFTL